MKTLYAEFTVKPGGEVRVAEMMRDLTRQVRLEPGNLLFSSYTKLERPNEYFVFEIYRDAEAFRSHISADHSRRFNAELAALIEGQASTLTSLQPSE